MPLVGAWVGQHPHYGAYLCEFAYFVVLVATTTFDFQKSLLFFALKKNTCRILPMVKNHLILTATLWNTSASR